MGDADSMSDPPRIAVVGSTMIELIAPADMNNPSR
jgi:hypothetical protein